MEVGVWGCTKNIVDKIMLLKSTESQNCLG